MEPVLTLRNLTKKFGYLTAVDSLSFTLHKGNVYGILGPNGSGKSTTLGMVLDVVNKTSGDFQWFNGTISTQDALKKIGAIIERPNFYPYMSAARNLELVAKIKGAPLAAIEEKLHIVGLLEHKDRKFQVYSLGMKQRLAIASALLNNPEILILDEPTNGLDPQGIHQVRAIIKTIAAEGTTILLASHLLDEVEKVCSHVVILQKGKKLYAGSVDGMTATHGFLELNSSDNDKLIEILQQHPAFGAIKTEGDFIRVFLNSPIDAAEVNALLHQRHIILSHLVKRRESLEEQFLSLTETTPSQSLSK